MRVTITPVILSAALLALLMSCGRETSTAGYIPGLGEIMALNQMRHAKLWFAGLESNWTLASYEVDELEEGFQDAMTFHPTHKTAPLPLTSLIPRIIDPPLHGLRDAIGHKDSEAFERAFDTLTRACNACHQATNFAFNVVTRPTRNTFTNQDFRPQHQDD